MGTHVCFLAGSAVTWTIPTLRTEFNGQINRRQIVDLTNVTRARLYGGGGTNGSNGTELVAEYTLDLTGATGWTALGDYVDGADGPRMSVSHTGDETQWSPWCTVEVAARTTVMVRVVGEGGDGATLQSFGTLGLEFAGVPLYASQSLEGVTLTGKNYGFIGASHMGGGGIPAEFGSLAVPLRAVPTGAVMRRNGALLVAHTPDDHGVEAGFLAEFSDQGLASGTTIVCRYVAATDVSDWVTTHFATFVADCTTQGITPTVVFYGAGRQEGDSLAKLFNSDQQLRKLRGLVQKTYPGCGFVVIGQTGESDVSEAFVDEARVIHHRRFIEPWWGRQGWISGEGVAGQVTNEHPTTDGEVDMGRRFAEFVIDRGII